MLGVLSMDRHLDRQTSTPPRHPPISGCGERPDVRRGIRVSQLVEYAVQVVGVPGRQIVLSVWGGVNYASTDASSRREDGGNPRENPASVANQFRAIPPGTGGDRTVSVGLDGGEQPAAVDGHHTQ